MLPPVTPGWLCPLSATRLALLVLRGALLSGVPRLTLLGPPFLLGGSRGLRLVLPAELASRLALLRSPSGLTRLPAMLAGLLGVAALLPRRGAARLPVWPTLLLAALPRRVARSRLASPGVLPVTRSLPALSPPLSAALSASVPGVAVLPAHVRSGGPTRNSD